MAKKKQAPIQRQKKKEEQIQVLSDQWVDKNSL